MIDIIFEFEIENDDLKYLSKRDVNEIEQMVVNEISRRIVKSKKRFKVIAG